MVRRAPTHLNPGPGTSRSPGRPRRPWRRSLELLQLVVVLAVIGVVVAVIRPTYLQVTGRAADEAALAELRVTWKVAYSEYLLRGGDGPFTYEDFLAWLNPPPDGEAALGPGTWARLLPVGDRKVVPGASGAWAPGELAADVAPNGQQAALATRSRSGRCVVLVGDGEQILAAGVVSWNPVTGCDSAGAGELDPALAPVVSSMVPAGPEPVAAEPAWSVTGSDVVAVFERVRGATGYSVVCEPGSGDPVVVTVTADPDEGVDPDGPEGPEGPGQREVPVTLSAGTWQCRVDVTHPGGVVVGSPTQLEVTGGGSGSGDPGPGVDVWDAQVSGYCGKVVAAVAGAALTQVTVTRTDGTTWMAWPGVSDDGWVGSPGGTVASVTAVVSGPGLGTVEITGSVVSCGSLPSNRPVIVAAFDDDGFTVASTKDLSNVVARWPDGTTYKWDGLTEPTGAWAGTGSVSGIWVKSGSNASGDCPGCGQWFGNPHADPPWSP